MTSTKVSLTVAVRRPARAKCSARSVRQLGLCSAVWSRSRSRAAKRRAIAAVDLGELQAVVAVGVGKHERLLLARCRGQVLRVGADGRGGRQNQDGSAAGRARQGQEATDISAPAPLGTGCHRLPKGRAQGGRPRLGPCRAAPRRYGPRPEPRPEGGQSHAARNLIGGEWVEGAQASRRHQPVQHRRRGRRVRAGRPGAGAGRDRGRQGGLPGLARPARRSSGPTRWTGSAPRSWPARRSWGGCCRARRARPCPRASARPRARARSSSSSPVQALSLAGDLVPSVRPGVTVEVTREPVGVVGLITPWNFPIAIPAWKIAPALAYGNCVVFKPADLVPGSAWALAEIISRAGLPAGRVQPGDGPRLGGRRGADRARRTWRRSASPARSRPAAASPPSCAAGMKKFQLEMGGKNPLVVLDDADLETAVNCAVQGAFYSTGQRCTASSRLIVAEGIHDRFVAAVTGELQRAGGGRRAQAGDADRPGGRPEAARPGLRYVEHRPRGGCRSSPGAASGSIARRPASICSRRCSPTPATRCGSTARRSSGRWPR